jgi:hypothetical protein
MSNNSYQERRRDWPDEARQPAQTCAVVPIPTANWLKDERGNLTSFVVKRFFILLLNYSNLILTQSSYQERRRDWPDEARQPAQTCAVVPIPTANWLKDERGNLNLFRRKEVFYFTFR